MVSSSRCGARLPLSLGRGDELCGRCRVVGRTCLRLSLLWCVVLWLCVAVVSCDDGGRTRVTRRVSVRASVGAGRLRRAYRVRRRRVRVRLHRVRRRAGARRRRVVRARRALLR